jgi:formylglycine-generating enzyme
MTLTSRITPMLILCAALPHAGALVTVDTVTVGNANNWPDLRYGTPGFGSVLYTYEISTYEVTASQYTEFLNAVAAADPYELYNAFMWSSEYGCKIQRSGSSGSYSYAVAAEWANRPVNYISWGDAARFCNWLHNGQPSEPEGFATTENGSYFLNGALTDSELLTITREPDATWVIPSEDEWYKAAYHKNDGVTDHYWDYPTSSDTPPGNDLITPDPGNYANYYDGVYTIGSPYWRTAVGEFENSASPYGTFDQGGNIWEWNESVLLYNTSRGMRGGSFYHYGVELLHASTRSSEPPSFEDSYLGLRLIRLSQPGMVGDLNCDGLVNTFDIDPFVLALTDPAGYAAAYPSCNILNADVNCDGSVNTFDIDPFVLCLTGGGCAPCP